MKEDRLAHLEVVIDNNRRNFYTLGSALKEIHEKKLYRKIFYTRFDIYVKNRWDMGRNHAYRLIEASSVIDNLSPIGEILPENEFQTRPLSKLDGREQREIWREFVQSGMQLSAVNIRRFIQKRTGGERQKISRRTDLIGPAYREAVMALLDQIRTARNDRWQSTSREAALHWIGVMKNKIMEEVR